jgi:lambda repressor-like predicted transcriptional regulator
MILGFGTESGQLITCIWWLGARIQFSKLRVSSQPGSHAERLGQLLFFNPNFVARDSATKYSIYVIIDWLARVALLRKGISQREIARREKVPRGFVNQVIHRRRKTRRIRQAIARAMGEPYDKVWPDE